MKKRGRIKLRRLKTWWLGVILVPLLFIDVTLLRQGHIRMAELRDAVMVADEGEDDEAIERALIELKEYVFGNVVVNVVEDNGVQRVTFGTGPFYLEHQYIRAANRALAEAEAALTGDSNPNGNIYALAAEVCKGQALANGWTWSSPEYINCMVSEIQKYPAASEIEDTIVAALPSTELYKHNYASPVWAPTLTGWMILLTLGIVVVILIRVVWWVILRLSLLLI